jgi:hypothetical protein
MKLPWTSRKNAERVEKLATEADRVAAEAIKNCREAVELANRLLEINASLLLQCQQAVSRPVEIELKPTLAELLRDLAPVSKMVN